MCVPHSKILKELKKKILPLLKPEGMFFDIKGKFRRHSLKNYWSLLKSRASYQKCILDFYGEKENNDIDSVFGKKDSMHLEPLTNMIKNYES